MTRVLYLSVVLLALGSSSVIAEDTFEGEWNNVDIKKGGLHSVKISKTGTGWKIQAWDTDAYLRKKLLGTAALRPQADAVRDSKVLEAVIHDQRIQDGLLSKTKRSKHIHMFLQLKEGELAITSGGKVERFKKK